MGVYYCRVCGMWPNHKPGCSEEPTFKRATDMNPNPTTEEKRRRKACLEIRLRNMTTGELLSYSDSTPHKSPLELELSARLSVTSDTYSRR